MIWFSRDERVKKPGKGQTDGNVEDIAPLMFIIMKNFNISETLPIELETAISPKPFLATITEVIKSGTEVPAAKNVRPIMACGIAISAPITSAIQTMM